MILTKGSRKFMPHVASGISAVSDGEKVVLKAWIRNGAYD